MDSAERKLFKKYLRLLPWVAILVASISITARAETQDDATKQNEMYAYLNRVLPSWKTQNTDPKFIAWTNLYNGRTGKGRIADELARAYAARDGAGVFRVFVGYLEYEASLSGSGSQTPDDFDNAATFLASAAVSDKICGTKSQLATMKQGFGWYFKADKEITKQITYAMVEGVNDHLNETGPAKWCETYRATMRPVYGKDPE